MHLLHLERKKSALKILAVKARFNNLARPLVGSNDDLKLSTFTDLLFFR